MLDTLKNYRKAIAFLAIAVFNGIAIILFPSFFGNNVVLNTILVIVLSYLTLSQLFGKAHSIAWPVLWSILMVFGPLGWFWGLVPTVLFWYLFPHRKRTETTTEESSSESAEEPSTDDLLNNWFSEAVQNRDRKSLKALAKAKMARAQESSNKKKTPKPSVTRHARIPFIRIPIPLYTYTISSKGIIRHWGLGLHGRDPEEWSNIKNLDITGSTLASILGVSTLCFQSNKLGELEYRKWHFIPNEIARLIEDYYANR